MKFQRVSSEDSRTPVRGQALKQKCRNAVCVEFLATTQSCCERSLESVNRVTVIRIFHCWRQTLPLRRVLFHPASEKEIVRDVTEKRLLHRVFIATQSPYRLHVLADGTFSLLAPNTRFHWTLPRYDFKRNRFNQASSPNSQDPSKVLVSSSESRVSRPHFGELSQVAIECLHSRASVSVCWTT